MTSLDNLDKKILNIIQQDFPIAERPYLELAQRLGTSEDQVVQKVKEMREHGYIRRLGGVFDTNKLGFETILIAIKADPDKVEEIAWQVNKFPRVTHNYERDHDFNLWFTMAARDQEELEEQLQKINTLPGVNRLLKLPAIKLFKIGVNFRMSEQE